MATKTMNKDEILDAIGNMSVFDLAELIEAFKTKFNVTIAAAARRQKLPRPKRRPSSRSFSRKPAPRRSRSSRPSAR